MKKIIILSFCAVTALTATSCKKSWNCICRDNDGNQLSVKTFKETKFLDASSKCDEIQADARSLNPNISCSVK